VGQRCKPPFGTVLRTSPGAGGQAAPNSGVDLVIAEEAELTVMPNVIGLELRPVIDFLTERGYTVDVNLRPEPTGDEASDSASQRKLDVEHNPYLIFYQEPDAGFDFSAVYNRQAWHIKLLVDDRGPFPGQV